MRKEKNNRPLTAIVQEGRVIYLQGLLIAPASVTATTAAVAAPASTTARPAATPVFPWFGFVDGQ
jgi:hypothetical protein